MNALWKLFEKQTLQCSRRDVVLTCHELFLLIQSICETIVQNVVKAWHLADMMQRSYQSLLASDPILKFKMADFAAILKWPRYIFLEKNWNNGRKVLHKQMLMELGTFTLYYNQSHTWILFDLLGKRISPRTKTLLQCWFLGFLR